MNPELVTFISFIWPDDFVARGIVGAILLVLFLTAFVGARHASRYSRIEEENLKRVERELGDRCSATYRSGMSDREPSKSDRPGSEEDKDEARVETPITPPPLSLMDLDDLRTGIDAKSLIHDRITAIATLREHRVKINVHTLQQLTSAKEDATGGLAFPHFAVGLSMILGILGTFYGLSDVVQEVLSATRDLDSVKGMQAWKESVEQIQQLLKGMESAFSTTLMGMFSALGCLLIGFGLRRKQASFTQRMEEFTVKCLIPATAPTVEDESMLERVSHQLEQSFDELRDAFQTNSQVLEDLTAAASSLQTIVDEVRSITKSEASRDLEKVIAHLGEATGSIVALGEHMPGVIERIGETNRSLENGMIGIARGLGADAAAWRWVGARPRTCLLFVALVLVFVALLLFR